MRTLASWLPLLLLATSCIPLAGADGDGAHETVWDEPRTLEFEDHVVREGERLVIRGTTVTFEGATLEIQPGGELVVESTPERSARLVGLNQTWRTKMYGDARIVGLPERPVIVEGIGGMGGFAPDAPVVNFRDGFTVARGSFFVRHAEFLNYTSGVHAGANASLDIQDARFSSPAGAGLLLSSVHVNLTDVRFEGPGGNVYQTLSLSPASFRNLTFTNTTRSLVLRDSSVAVDDLTVTGSGICIDVVGGQRVEVTVDGLRCLDFKGTGVHIHSIRGTTPGNASVLISNAEISSKSAMANAIIAESNANLTIEDSVLGPVDGPYAALAAEGNLPRIRNVTFRDVAGWNVHLISPGEIPREPLGQGDSGSEGWQVVSEYATVRVLGAEGNAAGTAHVSFFLESNGTLAAARDIGQLEKKLLFEVFRITPEGEARDSTFRVLAQDDAGNSREIHGFDPKTRSLVIQMSGGGDGGSGEIVDAVPGAHLAWLLAGVAFVAALRRGARRT